MPNQYDSMERGANEVGKLMQDSRNFNAVAERLRADCLNMTPEDFGRFARMVDRRDNLGGIDLSVGSTSEGLPQLTLVDTNSNIIDRKVLQRGETTINTQSSYNEITTPSATYVETRR